MLSELPLRPVLLAAALCVVCLFVSFLRRRPRLSSIPIIGAHESDWFPLLQAKWRNTKDFKAAIELAYAQYRGQAVLLPVAGEGDIVLLPSSEIGFVIDQPDSVLSFNERAFEMYQIDYTFMDPMVPRIAQHVTLIRTALTPQIGNLIPALADEVEWAFEEHWGIITSEWRELCVFDTLRHIVGGVANRAFVGLPFCRNPELVNSGMAFAVDIPLSGAIINTFWKPLHPLVAPFITIPNRIHTRQFRKILKSEIDRRLRDYDARQANPEDKLLEPEPSDLLQWLIQHAKDQGNPSMWRNATLADGMLTINFAAIYTTSFTLTWAIFDIVSSTPKVLDELRDEITSVLAANNGRWTKRALAQLKKMDSALRESARLSSVVIGLGRVVVADDGLTTPSGVHLPKGTHVSVPVYTVMRDDEVYVDAKTYTPFRFYGEYSTRSDESVNWAPDSLPITTSNFLFFGHGKHACPGRFFATIELKLILAYALLKYDFELLTIKPEGLWYGVHRLPPMTANIKVKRREKF